MKKLLVNPVFLSMGYALLAIILGLVIILGLTRRILDSAQYDSANAVPLYRGQLVQQSIRPDHSGLSTILIYLKNPGVLNHDPFNFRLLDSQLQVIREININGTNIGDGETVRFQFPPVVDSAGKKYVIELTSSTVAEQFAVKAGVSASDWYPEGQLLVPSRPSSDLSFQLYYQPQDKPQLLREVGSFIVRRIVNSSYILLVTACFVIFYWWMKRLRL